MALNRKLLIGFVLLMILCFFAGCSQQLSDSNTMAEGGILDLTSFNFEKEIARLDGEWEFYWNQLIEPKDIDTSLAPSYIYSPSSWNKHLINEGTSGNGYATYRLTFITDENQRLALKVPRMLTAYKLWINGELSAASGTVGTTRSTMIPQYLPQVVCFEAQSGNNELLIQVSNFYHRSGGILESIQLSSEKQILGLRYKNIANNILLFGCLIFAGLYHLALFCFRKKNLSALYFGLFCLFIGTRTLLVGECFFIFLFPGFSWEIAHKLMTLTYYLGVPLILTFFLSVFPTYFHIRMVKIAQIMALLFASIITFTPARIFTFVNPIYQVWTVIVIIYILSVLANIAIHREKNSALIVFGAAFFLLTVINDIIFVSIWVNDSGATFLKSWFKTGNLSSLGLLIFAFANSLLIARMFSDALEHEEIMTAKLSEINTNLDEIVFERTKALMELNDEVELQKCELAEANQQLQKLSLKDPLTNLWNRRKYDETIALEWNRCLRYERPLALMFIDIDFFKRYNDYYGHLAGDECLVKIGKTIKESLSRSADMAARYGGEEFIVILPEIEKEESIKVAEMLRQKIEALHIPHIQSLVNNYVTVSIGVTNMIPDKSSSPENMFIIADKALYKAKAEGRNRVKHLLP